MLSLDVVTGAIAGLAGGGAMASLIQSLSARKLTDVQVKKLAKDAMVEDAQAGEIFNRLAAQAGIDLEKSRTDLARVTAQAAEATAKADLAGRELTRLEVRVKMHEKRWDYILPILEKCSRNDPDAKARLEQVRDLQAIAAWDDAATMKRREEVIEHEPGQQPSV